MVPPLRIPAANPLPRKPRTWSGLVAIAGALTAYLSMIAANGNGWSPIIFLAIGFFGAPVIAWVLRWTQLRPWPARGLAVLAVALACFVMAKISARIDTGRAFAETFGMPPPPGLKLIAARKQWHDGYDLLLAFESDRAGIDTLLAAQKYEDQSDLPATRMTTPRMNG